MKYIWEEKDIDCGILISKENIEEAWMIGYSYTVEAQLYNFISMSDGFITYGMSKEKFVEALNSGNYIPFKYLDKDIVLG